MAMPIVALVLLSPLEAASPKRDYAAAAWTILPPGENGSLTFNRNTRDQAQLYDALTPLFGTVTARDIRRTFKPAPLGAPPKAGARRERPRPGVTIVRDSFGVAQVTGRTEADVAFGAGWVTAADRGLLLQLIRGPARVAALDVPGLDPLALALTGKTFVPSAEAEAFLANQLDAVRSQGAVGRKVLALISAYSAGINAYYRAKGIPATPFTARDVVASAALIAARFGTNGGQEAQNAMFLDALEGRLGAADARRVFADLRAANDIEAPVSVRGSFPHQLPPETVAGQRRPRRRELPWRAARCAGLRVECAPGRSEALRDRAPALRRRAAGGLLLPAVLRRDGAPGCGLRRARGGLSRSPAGPHRPRSRFRVERDVVAGRQPRPLRRRAV